jgi:hypothetical protein
MKLSKLQELSVSRNLIDVFRGYNHNLRIGEGEFFDMTNLSSDNYPVLSPRKKRGIYAVPSTPRGLIAKDKLCYVDGGDIIIGDDRVEMGLSVDTSIKTLVSMGAYIIILPDKKYINTADIEDFGDIEAEITTSSATTFELCKYDGVKYEDVVAQEEAPESPTNMSLWIDTSSTPHTLNQYSSTNEMWVPIPTTYIKISSPGIGEPFEEGDGVNISGIESPQLEDLNDAMFVEAKGDDFIVVTGILDEVTTQETPITVKRQMPIMDYVIESGNRLWGCRYGKAINGEMVNEIYASKLGDFKNWNCYAGVSTDSYAVTVGSDGAFTGAIEHRGYPLFFKESCMHKVYGSYPANYQLQTTTCRGVQTGCDKSLAIVNEVLYYKTRSGVCAYDGSLPADISSAFGDVNYYNAVAGALGNKYYISMADADDAWHLFVFDASKGMWHKEDDTQVMDFCAFGGDLYYTDYADKHIKTMRGTGMAEESDFKWSAVSGLIGTDSPDKKYISRMDVRMSLQAGARVSFYAEYDSSGEWEYLFTMDGIKLQTFAVPISPKRCDHMRLRIVGYGEAKIHSICKNVEKGSDI